MSSDLLPGFMQDLPQDDVLDAAYWFTSCDVDYGTALIEEGEEDASLIVVLEGELSIRSGRVELGTARKDDIVGECEMFGDPLRIASVRAVAPSRLLVLDRDAYEALRDMGNTVAWALERTVLAQLCRQVRELEHRVLHATSGSDVDPLEPPSALSRMMGVLSPSVLFGPRGIDAVAALRKSSAFSAATDQELTQLGARATARAFAPGQLLFRQGDVPNRLHLVIDGAIDLVATTAQGNRVSAGTIGPGGLCGGLELVDGAPRFAEARVRESTTALELRGAAFLDVFHREDLVGSALRNAMIRTLANQQAAARARLSMHEAMQEPIGFDAQRNPRVATA